ncbi:hypothetical protein NJC40_03585 [Pseudomonas sp. 21LCFQ02]|uniref:hypothetical protein n=1 Tax=Pseudomonas sp. 21LCFQ02 TaxID=2957505 RepID=UPI00209BA9C9|nr:hypothetical protein [Pseudomonas sp. 21LCFQ02]MCO8166860.1 hypothetical protein [Pseudomonas sp. 21LCFQ02]
MTSSRQQFEARYPIPTGVEWSEEEGRYQPVDGKYVAGFSIRQYEAHIGAWGVWKASREDVVVKLPEPQSCDDGWGWIDYEDACTAVQAAGLRVSP